MRTDIERWFLQSKEEFEVAKISFKAEKWFAVAFWSQQFVEKALKALFIYKKKEAPGNSHSLTYLGRELEIPNKYWKFLRELTKEYFMSRYPDASDDIPYLLYTKEDAEYFLEIGEKLLKWVEQEMKM